MNKQMYNFKENKNIQTNIQFKKKYVYKDKFVLI